MTNVEKQQPLSMRINEAKWLVRRGICTINDAATYFSLNADEYNALYSACLTEYEQLHDEKPKLRVFSIVLKQDEEPANILAFGHSYAEVSSQYEAVEQYDILNVHEVTGVCHDMVNTPPDEWTAEQRKLAVPFLRAMNNFLF